MRLILLRHGKAADATLDQRDDDRMLTTVGRQELEERYANLARFLNNQPRCEVWTSSKLRAIESAEALCRYMPKIEPQVREFISDGDFAGLRSALEDCHKNDTIVIVGHEPYLSNWIQELTGVETHIKKGRGELLYLRPDNVQKAVRISALTFSKMRDLEWYLLPIDFGMEHLLRHQHEQIMENRDAFLSDPDDKKALSQLRTTLRIQFALLQFMRPYCKRKAYERAEEQYQKLYSYLERSRNIEAILKTIRNARNEHLAPLEQTLMADRNAEMLSLSDILSSPEMENDYHEALNLAIEAVFTLKTDKKLIDVVRNQFEERYDVIHERIDNSDLEHLSDVEELRELCKTSRYIFEIFSPLANYRMSRQYLRMRRLNHRLGLYCDTFYNTNDIRRLLGSELTDTNLMLALSVYESMQRRTADIERRAIQHILDELPYDTHH